MGCDIHPAVEVRRKGIWRYHRPVTPCRWYLETWDDQTDVDAANTRMEEYAKTNPKYKDKPIKLGDRRRPWDRCKTRLPDFFRDRNYLKFAILGDVRNDYGFIASDGTRFNELPSMSDNRGIPADISPEARRQLSNEHSQTYVNLREMMDWPYWDGSLLVRGVVDETTFLREVILGEQPSHWSGGVFGGTNVTLKPAAYVELFGEPARWWTQQPAKPRTYDPAKTYNIEHEWQVPLSTAGHQIDEIITYMYDLIPKGGTAEDVRLVMDFDS